MPQDDDIFQRGLIITDDVAIDPVLDFDTYRDAIVKIITASYPKFTVGIFGDWGSGKTTLINSIADQIQKGEEFHLTAKDGYDYCKKCKCHTFVGHTTEVFEF